MLYRLYFFIILLLILALFIGLFGFCEQLYWKYETPKIKYKIEIELLNRTVDTIEIVNYDKMEYKINCHSHKGYFQNCNLECTPKNGELWVGGDWKIVRSGVIGYKILN